MYVPGEAEYATAWTGPLIQAEVSRRNMGRRRKEKREPRRRRMSHGAAGATPEAEGGGDGDGTTVVSVVKPYVQRR